MFKRILIANRGEIADRILRTIHKLNIQAVAVYDEREKDAAYVRLADHSVCLGTGSLNDTYLNIEGLIAIARKNHCEAIHPGYGFLAENAEFAKRCELNGIAFIGPQSGTIALMGDKLASTALAESLGLPVIPQLRGSVEEILQNADSTFYPCLVKASAGGGGKGMRKADHEEQLKNFLIKTSSQADKYFGNGKVYAEKYLENPRHIEVQVLADTLGNTVHLFERECSVQRHFQKIIEEAPATGIPQSLKENLYREAILIAKEVNYSGAGTVEFLIDTSGNYYFLEMNTRIQVEHGVTELITGIDIVEEQIGIAAGHPISQQALESHLEGHAIEARLYAEVPEEDFKPSPGRIRLFSIPQKKGIRIDTAYTSDSQVLSDFDPMLAKIMVHGKDRDDAINILKKTVVDSVIHGVKHNLGLISNILDEPDFLANNISTHYLDRHPDVLYSAKDLTQSERNVVLAAGLFISLRDYPYDSPLLRRNSLPDYWRLLKILNVSLDKGLYKVRINAVNASGLSFTTDDEVIEAGVIQDEEQHLAVHISGMHKKVLYSWDPIKLSISLSIDNREFDFRRLDFLSREFYSDRHTGNSAMDPSNIRAPLSGKVIKVNVNNDQEARRGDTLLVIESMKMENEVRISSDGHIRHVLVNRGQMVNEGDILVQLRKSG